MMESAQNMPQRIIRYVGKLLMFVTVPGLHLLSCGRVKTGFVLLGLFLVTQIIQFMPNLGSAYLSYMLTVYPFVIGLIIAMATLVFIVMDLPSIGVRPVSKPGGFVFLITISMLVIAPNSNNNIALLNADHMCPEFCFGDVVVLEAIEDSERIVQTGDVVAYRHGRAIHVNRIVAGAGQIVCVIKPFQVDVRTKFGKICDENYKLEDRFFFVSGDNSTPTRLGTTSHHKVVHQDDIQGFRPVVVANWSNWVNTLSYFMDM
jgi:hypothetical protein